MRLVAFDPGETTGFCEAVALSGDSLQIVKSSTIAWPDRFTIRQLLLGTDQAPLPDAIIVESFRLYAHKARNQINNDFPSSQVIGIIETYAYELGVQERVFKQPASVMSRVQILAEHAPALARAEHARDAYKHLRYYYVTRIKTE